MILTKPSVLFLQFSIFLCSDQADGFTAIRPFAASLCAAAGARAGGGKAHARTPSSGSDGPEIVVFMNNSRLFFNFQFIDF